jgi:ArsR family transcriptional regulator, virulence genes transcriptional regulator
MDELKETLYDMHARILKALANPRRLMIMDQLHGGPKTVSELVALLGLPQANVSQHLAAIREQGIVVAHRQGNTVSYSLSDLRIIEACDLFREFLAGRIRTNQTLADQLDLIRTT